MLGRTIHTYRIEELLGEGGMGTVYRAVDTVLGRDVALKVLHPALVRQASFLERFRSEARVLARLNHPNVAVLHNFLEVDDDLVMVMEYVEGLNLDALLRRRGKLTPAEALPLVRQALEGLHHAHRRGILHRDLKPANLMVTPDGQVKVMDFGIAKVAGAQRLTQANHLVGTLEYLAPEQVRGEEPSPASDLYAVGVLLYELLTGRVPFAGTSDYTLMDRILREKPTAPIKLNAALPKALDEVLRRSLDKNPADRYPDARALSAALAEVVPSLHVDFMALTALPTEPVRATVETKAKTPPLTEWVGTKRSSSSGRQTLPGWTRVPFQRDYRILTASVFVAAALLLGGIWLSPPVDKPGTEPQTAQVVPGASALTGTERPSGEPVEARENRPVETSPVVTKPKASSPEPTKPTEKPTEPRTVPKRKRLETPAESPTPKTVVPEPEPQAPVSSAPTVIEKPVETSRPAARRSILLGSKSVVLELLDGISSEQAGMQGRRLHFRATQAVVVDGEVVIRAGAGAVGEVTEVKSAGTFRRPRLEFRIRAVEGADGRMIPLRSATFREVATSADAVVRFVAGQTFQVRTESGVTVGL
jgi:serine/threonine-protein kinase